MGQYAMVATVIFSYDCESKWGMVDRLEALPKAAFASDAIRDAYEFLLAQHAALKLPATFGFVSAFTMSRDRFLVSACEAPRDDPKLNAWLSAVERTPEDDQGWFMPEILDLVLSQGVRHEIATHGFSHVPLAGLSEAALTFEAAEIRDWCESKRIDLSTMIFPRNLVNTEIFEHLPAIQGYRGAPKQNRFLSRSKKVGTLVKELWPRTLAETCTRCTSSGLTMLPGDFFINWRHGPRRIIPVEMTLIRARSALKHASDTSGVVGFWLHPHNLNTGRDQRHLFSSILQLVGEFVDEGRALVKTQAEVTREFVLSEPVRPKL